MGVEETGRRNPSRRICLKGGSPPPRPFLFQKLGFWTQSYPRRITAKAVQPGQGSPGGDDGEDNSLLNHDNTVRGEIVPFNPSSVLGTPGVYAITCKATSMTYVGEGRNLRRRVQKHLAELRSRVHANSRFQAAFDQYGEDGFFLIINAQRGDWALTDKRRERERMLQAQLKAVNLVYNSTTAETKTERNYGEFGNQPGIVLCVCKPTNTYYYATTTQSGGCSHKIGRLKAYLNNGTLRNASLLADWRKYGEENFEFSVVAKGDDYLTTEQMNNGLIRLVKAHFDNGGLLYNRHKNGIPRNPPNQPETSASSEVKNATPVMVWGTVYLSLAEAARCLGMSVDAVRSRIANGMIRFATDQEVEIETRRRESSSSGCPPVLLLFVDMPRNHRISINGTTFVNARLAALALGLSVPLIHAAVREAQPGYFFVDDAGRPIPYPPVN